MRWLALALLLLSASVVAQDARPHFHGSFGVGGTSIEVDGGFRDYESATGFGMVEAGTRLRIGRAQVGIAFIGRYQSMDRSELEGNSFIFGYDSEFEGVLFTAGFCF